MICGAWARPTCVSTILSSCDERYEKPGQPAAVHELLLPRIDGRFALVVWDERFTGGSDHVTIKLGASAASVKVDGPAIGTSPIQSLSQVRSLGLTLSNHPVVIEFTAPIRSAGATPPGGTGGGRAVLQIV